MALTRRPTPIPIPSEPLTPSEIYLLVIGRECTEWLPGWVALATDGRSRDEIRLALWPTAGGQIVAETAPFGFEPWGETGRRPKGPGVTEWERAFIASHGRT